MSTAQTRDKCEILDRKPPSDLHAEKATLGSVLLDPGVCDGVCEIVRASDFHGVKNALVFEHILALRDEGKRADIVLLLDRLRRDPRWEDYHEAAAYLGEVASSVPYAANAVYYAKIVRGKSRLRTMAAICTDALQQIHDPAADDTKVAEWLHSLVIETKAWGQ